MTSYEPPWVNDPPNPCDECTPEKIPRGFECQDGENFNDCPRWNPEPVRCDICGKILSGPWIRQMMCKECEAEEIRLRSSEEMDNWEEYL